MARFIVKRLALGLITLWLLSVLVFFMANVLPGNVGRRVLGPFASQTAVDALNHQLGTDQPLLDPVLEPDEGLPARRHGHVGVDPPADLGASLWPALVHSAKLAVLAFIIVVPLAILGGVVAALQGGHAARPGDHRRRPVGDGDPRVRLGGRPAARVLALARDLPVDRRRGPTARASSRRSSTCSCPRSASCSSCSATSRGWPARARSRSLDADYTRTAVHQGAAAAHGAPAPRAAQLAAADDRGHRDPGRLPDRRPRRDRADLQLPGDRPADLPRRDAEGLPGAARRRCWSSASSSSSRRWSPTSLYSVLNPRVRLGERGPVSAGAPTPAIEPVGDVTVAGRPAARRRQARPPRAPRRSCPLEVVHRRRDHRRLLGDLRDLRQLLVPRTRSRRTRSTSCRRRAPTTGSAPTASAATCSRASSSARATS